jgi:hypothetical protein
MRIIQQPIIKMDDGTESAHCNFTLNVTADTGDEYIISISADDNLGSGNRGNGKHDCYRTQLALFRDVKGKKNNEMLKHCSAIMQRVLGKGNYIDHPSDDDLLELLYYLKNELKKDLTFSTELLGEAK